MTDTINEYGVRDQHGTFWGLPARTFTSREAADEVITLIRNRRDEMKDRADAAMRIEPQARSLTDLDAIEVWMKERDRHYRVWVRPVGFWKLDA